MTVPKENGVGAVLLPLPTPHVGGVNAATVLGIALEKAGTVVIDVIAIIMMHLREHLPVKPGSSTGGKRQLFLLHPLPVSMVAVLAAGIVSIEGVLLLQLARGVGGVPTVSVHQSRGSKRHLRGITHGVTPLARIPRLSKSRFMGALLPALSSRILVLG